MAQQIRNTTVKNSAFVHFIALGLHVELHWRGISAMRFAEMANIPDATVRRILDGRFDLDLITIEILCCALEIDPSDLVQRGQHLAEAEATKRTPYSTASFVMPFPGE